MRSRTRGTDTRDKYRDIQQRAIEWLRANGPTPTPVLAVKLGVHPTELGGALRYSKSFRLEENGTRHSKERTAYLCDARIQGAPYGRSSQGNCEV